jgi:hypothetical protein
MFHARLQPISKGSDWIEIVELADIETGEPVDFTGATFRVTLRRKGDTSPEITGTSSTGEVISPEAGIVHIQFLASSLGSLDPGEYDIGLKIERDGFAEALIIGTLPVIDGIA